MGAQLAAIPDVLRTSLWLYHFESAADRGTYESEEPKLTTIELIHAKRDDVLQIAQKHGVTSIRLFGSVARGEDSADSDIDLLVTTGPEVSSWFPAGLILELKELLGREVEIVTEPGLNSLVRDQVLAEAVAL